MTRSRSVELLDGQAPPRVKHAPKVRESSWEDVSDLVLAYGLVLDDWQDEVLRAGLGERKDGKWQCRQVGVCAPRQQGKTMLIAARVLAGLLLFDERVIIVSAHRLDTSREVFHRLVQLIEDSPALNDRVDFIGRSEMREYIRMKTGQEVRFKARAGGRVGRGFSADALLLDEAQLGLGEAEWSAILPTMSARPNPQVWLFGTPPDGDTDESAVFRRVRDLGIKGKDSRVAYLEWSAEPTDDFDDPMTWAKANPAYGSRISHEAIAAERSTMSDEQFAMERLGIWPDLTLGADRVVTTDAWSGLTISDPPVTWPLAAVGVDMDLTGRLWVTVAAHADDPNVHVELLPYDPFAMGSEAAVQWLWERCGRRLPVVMPADSGAAVLVAPMQARGMTKNVYRLSPHEMCDASAGLAQMAADRTLSHLDDEVLAECVAESERETRKPSGWRIARVGRTSSAPLLATACATHGAVKWSRRVDPNRSERRAVIL